MTALSILAELLGSAPPQPCKLTQPPRTPNPQQTKPTQANQGDSLMPVNVIIAIIAATDAAIATVCKATQNNPTDKS